jgi:hypothetical protein
MNIRPLACLGYGCLLGMTVRAAWVTTLFDWPMNLLALAAGVALLLDRRHA